MFYGLEQLILVVFPRVVVGYFNNHEVGLCGLVLEKVEKIHNSRFKRQDFKLLMTFIANVGRSKFDITREKLKTYFETGFSQGDITKFMKVSEKTIHRRVNKYNMHEKFPKHTNIAIFS